MHQEIAVIGQNPFALGVAFDADGAVALQPQLPVDLIGDGLHLPLVVAGADDEIIGKGGDAAQVQNDQVFGLFVFGRADRCEPARLIGFCRTFRAFQVYFAQERFSTFIVLWSCTP